MKIKISSRDKVFTLFTMKYSSICLCSKKTFTIVFNWNHFEMRLLNLRINFYLLRTFFVLILVVFCVVSSFTTFRPNFTSALRGPWRSGVRRWVSTVPGEHCQKIAVSNPTQAGQRFTWSKTWCDRQQLWKAVITGDSVTRLIIPIRGRGKSPEEGQRWNFAET